MLEQQLVTIASFQNEMEFLLARTRLESADIECFARDENMLRIAGWHGHVFGGVCLQVRENDVADALAILRHTAPLEAE
jgi:Putative prokaryotic signal transducing protein